MVPSRKAKEHLRKSFLSFRNLKAKETAKLIHILKVFMALNMNYVKRYTILEREFSIHLKKKSNFNFFVIKITDTILSYMILFILILAKIKGI
jgi:hypothetical protein